MLLLKLITTISLLATSLALGLPSNSFAAIPYKVETSVHGHAMYGTMTCALSRDDYTYGFQGSVSLATLDNSAQIVSNCQSGLESEVDSVQLWKVFIEYTGCNVFVSKTGETLTFVSSDCQGISGVKGEQ